MYSQEFILKYIFRLTHISTVVILGGKIIYDYLFPCGEPQNKVGSIVFASICGVLMMIAGFVNIFLLKGKQKLGEKYKFWVSMLHLKLVTSIIFLTPLFGFLVGKISEAPDQIVKTAQFIIVVAWLVISPFLRFYRELWAEVNRNKQVQ